MITELLMDGLFVIVNTLLSPLSSIQFDVSMSSLEPMLQYVRMAMYIIPFAQLTPILGFIVGMMAFRVTVTVIKTIWDLLPVV